VKSVLITGGSGSFGKECVSQLLKTDAERVVVFSRDELKQWEMKQAYTDPRLRFFIGDVRDKDRLRLAFHGVDTVIHAAALKQVGTGEYNPFEVVKTNIIGSQNIIEAALECGVERTIALSTDKACNPVNLYGAAKLCMERLLVSGNSYSGNRTPKPKFSIVRYGNVWGSRGSVVELFKKQAEELGYVTLTDRRMTRFFIEVEDAVKFVLECVGYMEGGEIFVPCMVHRSMLEVAGGVIPPGCIIKEIGVRPGEKLHETLITAEESVRTLDRGYHYEILPTVPEDDPDGRLVPEGFTYRSDM